MNAGVKTGLAVILLVGLAVVLAGAEPAAAPPGFAVVELFTSEGCSSCPPEDEALSAIAEDARRENLPLYTLEWHVDYWDYLGWKDPYDSRLATERQYAYARALPSSVFTPQVVVNGTIVPSYAGDRRGVESVARSLLDRAMPVSISLRVLPPRSSSGFTVEADVSGAPAGSNLMLAVVENGLEATPSAGENAGRRLLHSSVVREALVVPARSGEVAVTVPQGVDVSRSLLIGIVQDPRSMRIFGAAEASFPVTTGARVRGRVVDEKGTGAPGIRIQACSGTACVPTRSDAGGWFTVDGLAAGTWSLALEDRAPSLSVSLARDQSVAIERPLVYRTR